VFLSFFTQTGLRACLFCLVVSTRRVKQSGHVIFCIFQRIYGPVCRIIFTAAAFIVVKYASGWHLWILGEKLV